MCVCALCTTPSTIWCVDIFSAVKLSSLPYQLEASCVEIYNDKDRIRDLLQFEPGGSRSAISSA